MKSTIKELTRFDARLPKEQKQLFEKAAFIGGYRNFTDFVIQTLQKKAKEIIQENEQIIASEKDSRLFFEAITLPKNHQGKGFGKIILLDALRRSYEISKEMSSFAIVVDPIDTKAELFYTKYDFIKLPDSKKMFIANQTLKLLFE